MVITIIIISTIIAPTINIFSFNSPLPLGRCPLSIVQFILLALSQLAVLLMMITFRIILVMIMIMMMMTMTLADDAHRSHIKLMTM